MTLPGASLFLSAASLGASPHISTSGGGPPGPQMPVLHGPGEVPQYHTGCPAPT